MLDLRYVSENLEEVKEGLRKRGFDDPQTFEELGRLANLRRKLIKEVESLRAQRNEASERMAQLDKNSDEFAEQRGALRSLGEKVKQLEERHNKNEEKLRELLLRLPNLPEHSTPAGSGDESNLEVRVWGNKPVLGPRPKDHVDLGNSLGILDMERGAKISGARFVVLKGLGARMTRALMQFMLDVHADQHGYREIWPPVIIKDTSMMGTGQLPKFGQDSFRLASDWDEQGETAGHDLYLAPTAEVPVTNLHAEEILEAEDLPISYTAYTACFRSEAGSYGKDTRGMIRVHQFDKVELVRLVAPEDAEEEHQRLTRHAESILHRLGLHYRVMQLCAGDMGAAATKAYDLEVWLPGQQSYREISSCSWFGDYQARRMNCRYRPKPKAKPRFVHTMNGSALAIGRALVAILEQYQQEDGSVRVPEALVPYMGGIEVISPAS
jgi:seryl-tRNA synthetase